MTFDPNNPTEGIYPDLPEKVYREARAISQSEVKAFDEAATPLHFKAAKPREATADMEFGSVVHAAILTPEILHMAYYLRPQEYPAKDKKGVETMKLWHGGSDWCKEWTAKHQDRPVMTSEQIAKLPKIIQSMKALPEFGSALESGQTEVAFFKRDPETGLMLKCRVDLIASADDGTTWLFDPKKVQSGCATAAEFGKSADNYGYDIQAASYKFITGASRFIFVPFDDDEPFDCCQWEPDNEMLRIGYDRWRRMLLRYKACLDSGEWPGYPKGLRKLSLPDYALRRATGWAKG